MPVSNRKALHMFPAAPLAYAANTLFGDPYAPDRRRRRLRLRLAPLPGSTDRTR